MVLRNPLDHDVAKTPGTNMAYMWGNAGKGLKPTAPDVDDATAQKPRRAAAPKPVAVVAPAPAAKKETPFNMEIISGTSKTEVKFDKSGEGK
jgi:hypothetical protein